MGKRCNGCGVDEQLVVVPYVEFEATMSRQEKHTKRLYIIIFLLIISLIVTNLPWLTHDTKNETCICEQTQCIPTNDTTN